MYHFRKLLVLGVNEAIKHGRFSLQALYTGAPTDEDGHIMTKLASYPSVVLWNRISAGELWVSVWWNYDHSKHPQAEMQGDHRESFSGADPLAKRSHYQKFVGATASGWLERKTGKYLQGEGKNGIFNTYLRKNMNPILHAIPDLKPNGYAAEGRFHL